ALVEVEDECPRPITEYGCGSITMMGIEVDHEHVAGSAFVMKEFGRQGYVGVYTKAAARLAARVVKAAAQVYGQATRHGQSASKNSARGGPTHWREDSPFDQPAGQPAHDRQFQDAREIGWAFQRAQILRGVDRMKLHPRKPAGFHEITCPANS